MVMPMETFLMESWNKLLSMADANMYQNKKMNKTMLSLDKIVFLLYNQSRKRILKAVCNPN